jgi:hypothetical protein
VEVTTEFLVEVMKLPRMDNLIAVKDSIGKR